MARIDPTFGRPELAAVRDAAQRGDLRALGPALTTGLTGPHDRIDRMRVAADTLTARTGPNVPAGLDEWLRADPHNPAVLALRGQVEVLRAWAIRGDDLARLTEQARLVEFRRTLERAEYFARTAAEADPRDPAPWASLTLMARGQQVDTAELLRRRDGLEARAPQHFDSQAHAVIDLGPMWGGSNDLALEHLRRWVAAAPEGSCLPALFFVAQFQRYLRDEDRSFTRDEAVRDEGHRMADRLPRGHLSTPDAFIAHNYAAAWFVLAREPGRANTHFKLLRGYASEYPWYWLPSTGLTPLATFRGKRQNAWLRLPL